MKATIALSTLASLALVSAYEVAPVEKMSLRDALCKNVRVADKYTLKADCANTYSQGPLT